MVNACLPFDVSQLGLSCAKSIDGCVALCALPQGRRVVKVDIFEHNIVVNAEGKEVLRQVVLWNWLCYDLTWDYYVFQWKLASKCFGPELINGRWVGVFDGKTVTARMFLRTVSSVDYDLEDRKRLPDGKRSRLK